MFPRLVIGLVPSLLLVTLTSQFSLDHKRLSRKWNQKNQNAIFPGSYSSMLLIITSTLLLVKTSLQKWSHIFLNEP